MTREIVKGGVLSIILVIGLVLQGAGVSDLTGVTGWIEQQAHHWWSPVILVGLMDTRIRCCSVWCSVKPASSP